MAIKIPSREPKQIGSVTPISGNTKWIGAATAGGKGAQQLGEKIIAASRQMASVFAEDLDKQEKTTLLNSNRGKLRNWEYGSTEDNGEFGANSPYSLINTGSFGEYDPETNMMSNEVDLSKIDATIATMYDQYRKDHIDTIESDFVRNQMINEHATARANAITKAQAQSILYRKAKATSGYITDLQQTIDRLNSGSSEQINIAYGEVQDILSQFHLYPNLNPDLKYKYTQQAEDAYTVQRAFRAVTFDNLGFDYPNANVTSQGSLVTTTADQYDTAIRLLSGDFTVLSDTRFSEEKKEEIISAVLALDNGDLSMPAGGQRSSLIERLKKNKEIREGVIEKNQNSSLLNVKKTLDKELASGNLTIDLLNKIAPPHTVGQEIYNFYYGKIGKSKKTGFTTDEATVWRTFERELRTGNSQSAELQKIQSKYLADPAKTINDIQQYVLSKIPDLPMTYWDKIHKMVEEAAKSWDLSKDRANASIIAENALMLHIIEPEGQNANKLLNGSTSIAEAMAVLATKNEASVTEARRQVQTMMLNFEDLLDLTLERNLKAKGVSYEDQLRAPLYVKNEAGDAVIIDGTANNNYIVNHLVRTLMGDITSDWIPRQQEVEKAAVKAKVEAKENVDNRVNYSGPELTEQMNSWILAGSYDNNLLGVPTQIEFQDGSKVDLVAPEGMTAEQMKTMYWNQMATIQTGDPAKVIRIPDDMPIPVGWKTRTEPWKHQQTRTSMVTPVQKEETAQEIVGNLDDKSLETKPVRDVLYHPSGAIVYAYSPKEKELYLKNGYYETKKEAQSEF